MKLFDIAEPNTNYQELANNMQGVAIGIDLGTTNSLAAFVNKQGVVELIPDFNGMVITPSLVCYQDNKTLVGSEAVIGEGVIKSSKRMLAVGLYEAIHSGDVRSTPINVATDILRHIKNYAIHYLQEEVAAAVITVPAYFDEPARQATRKAAEDAGLKVLRLLNEPTAAAVAYGVDCANVSTYGYYLIYDLGGGTFDVSVLKITDGVLQVLATGGDPSLGGDDFDELLSNYIANKYSLALDQAAFAKLVQCKMQLSEIEQVSLKLMGLNITITRDELNNIIAPLIDKTIAITLATLQDAKLSLSMLHEIIMVGGATRTPAIREQVEKILGKQPKIDINPDEIVAVGAAMQAHRLYKNQHQQLLLDVIPISLGLEMADGTTEILIERNSPIPISITKTYTTDQDGQNAFLIHVLQGESAIACECKQIAAFKISGIPSLPKGMAKVHVTFQVDADGILVVTAYEANSGVRKEVMVSFSPNNTQSNV